jgi:hypothetical protein
MQDPIVPGPEEPSYPSAPGDRLIFENDRVRVWAMTLPAHGMYDFHQHFHDHLVLWPKAGRAEAQELGDPEWSISQTAEEGFVLFKTVGSGGPLTPHRIRNIDDFPNTHYIVELISEPSPSRTALPAETIDRGRSVDARVSPGPG